MSVFDETHNNKTLENILKGNPKINEPFQKLLSAFEESPQQDSKSRTKEKK